MLKNYNSQEIKFPSLPLNTPSAQPLPKRHNFNPLATKALLHNLLPLPQNYPLLTLINTIKLPAMPTQEPLQYLLRDIALLDDTSCNRFLKSSHNKLRAVRLREDARCGLSSSSFLGTD